MVGATNKEIARHLKISEKTVKYYMTQIMQKLEVQNRLQVVVAAQERLVRKKAGAGERLAAALSSGRLPGGGRALPAAPRAERAQLR